MGKNDYMEKPRRDFIILFLLYFMAHGGILLLSNAVYWDDWVLWRHDFSEIINFSKQWGAFLNLLGYMHIAILSIGLYTYKILTFLLIFFSGIFLYRILELQSWIRKESQFFIVVFYLVTPLYAARVSLAVFQYTLCSFFFFFAWFLMGKNRFFTLLFFFLSFNTQSLLVFYFLPILDLYFREPKHVRFSHFLEWSLHHLDYLVLPFVWFYLKIIFFKPFGFYEGYNEQYSLFNLVKAPIKQALDLFNLNVSLGYVLVGLAFSFLICRFFDLHPAVKSEKGKNWNVYFIAFLALLAGLFPYWILGHGPTFTEWTSRHQLLMPLGMAILCTALIASLGEKFGRAFLVLVLTISFAINWYNYTWFFIDWNKQKQIVSFLSRSEDVKSADLIVFEDKEKNALSRTYRFYEWNGLLKLATGDESKFGICWDEYFKYASGEYDQYFNKHYIAEKHRRSINQNKVFITITGRPFKYKFEVTNFPIL